MSEAEDSILLGKVDDLILQATTEKSHHYTAAVLKAMKAELDRLRRWPKAVAAVRALYPTEIFVGKTPDSDNAAWARMICDNIKREAEEGGDE